MKFLSMLPGLVLVVALFAVTTGRKSKKKRELCPEKVLMKKRSFEIDFDKNRFLKDGKPFQFISGDMHYFRVTSCHWLDRFTKMRHAGLNTVSTCVSYNIFFFNLLARYNYRYLWFPGKKNGLKLPVNIMMLISFL